MFSFLCSIVCMYMILIWLQSSGRFGANPVTIATNSSFIHATPWLPHHPHPHMHKFPRLMHILISQLMSCWRLRLGPGPLFFGQHIFSSVRCHMHAATIVTSIGLLCCHRSCNVSQVQDALGFQRRRITLFPNPLDLLSSSTKA